MFRPKCEAWEFLLQIDLDPRDWRSKRLPGDLRPKEPIFGSGVPFLIRMILFVVVATTIRAYLGK
jgi:hypothetical protein